MDGPMDELMGGLKGSLTESHGTTSRRLTYPMKIGHLGELLLSETATFWMIRSSFTNIAGNYDSPLPPS